MRVRVFYFKEDFLIRQPPAIFIFFRAKARAKCISDKETLNIKKPKSTEYVDIIISGISRRDFDVVRGWKIQ